MNVGVKEIKTIPLGVVKQFKVMWKPRCPMCGTPLNIVYESTSEGVLDEKCRKCGRRYLIELSSKEIKLIVD